jgi:hypothetical protein
VEFIFGALGNLFTVGFDSFFQWAISVSGLRCCTVGVIFLLPFHGFRLVLVGDCCVMGIFVCTGANVYSGCSTYTWRVLPLGFIVPWANLVLGALLLR